MFHRIKVNERTINVKPHGSQTGYISNGLTTEKSVTIAELAKLTTQPYGYTWTACYFENERSKENWKSQSIFYLDYDNGKSLEHIMEGLNEFSLRPNLIYNSLSDTIEKRKFRIVFFIDGRVYCPKTAHWIQNTLVKMFADSDQNVGSIERMIYPGFSVLHLDEKEICGDYLINVLNSYLISKDKKPDDNFYTRNMKQYEMSINEDDEIEYKIYFENEIITTDSDLPKVIPNFNWQKAFDEIRILKDFNNGVRLKHMEIFGLATNLMYIKGGIKWMKSKMEEVNRNSNRLDIDGKPADKYIYQQFATLPQVKKGKYKPSILCNFSPYKEDHEFHNILESIRWRKGRIDVLDKTNKISLKSAESILDNQFRNKIRSRINLDLGDLFESDTSPSYTQLVIVFKVPTGLGKTKQLESIENVLIAAKTNKLKSELSDRMTIEHYMTPDHPQFSCDKINDLMSSYIDSSLFEETSKIITKIANGKIIRLSTGDTFTPTESDQLLAENYKQTNSECRETKETVITTHKRALLDKNFTHDTIIFDECPLDSLFEMGSYTFNFSIFDATEFKHDVKPIEDWLRQEMGYNQIVEKRTFVIRNYTKFCEFCALNGESGLIKLLDSDFYFRDNSTNYTKNQVFFASKKEIPDKNIVIMSATAPVEIYKYIFGDRLEVIDITDVEKKGKIKQYTAKSWSRSSFLKSSESSLQEIKDIIGNKPVITFLKFKKVFENSVFHFGNTLGYDQLRGQDIAVVGTDNKPIYVYFFYAKLIGLDLKTSDNMLDVRIVEWNGFRFKTMTFENEILRNIQLSMIESELIQAVGRNRNLREDCETLLFSNQPLRISDEFID